ncbi:toxin HicA [Nocardia sp. NPDC055053]
MGKAGKILAKMRESPTNVRYSDLDLVCREYFKTPWSGDPRVNIQEGSNGAAKIYQVKQVLDAIDRLVEMQGREEDV